LRNAHYITNWNVGAQRIHQYAAAEIVGQHFSRFYSEEEQYRGEPARALQVARGLARAARQEPILGERRHRGGSLPQGSRTKGPATVKRSAPSDASNVSDCADRRCRSGEQRDENRAVSWCEIVAYRRAKAGSAFDDNRPSHQCCSS
jgi:hypothetical protein